MEDAASNTVTAALVVIGEEILSGRTRDENIFYIARYLARIGISLREVRVVRDLEPETHGPDDPRAGSRDAGSPSACVSLEE